LKEILENLNSRQKEAVTHPKGPILVLAGAGSGKTRVITHRIAYLIKNMKIKPWEILAVTFTNKAANEMNTRIKRLLENIKLSWMGTFHAICAKILRIELPALGRPNNFSIYDTADKLSLIKQCLKELNIDDKKYKPSLISSKISNAKNKLKTPDDFTEEAHGPLPELISKVYHQYQGKLEENNGMDFDDLIMKTVLLFKNNSEILSKYQEKFKHVLIDEYQDVNHSQYTLVKLLSEKHKNICAVGDDDQSIYGFRGADISYLFQFEKEFPGAKVVKLEENYRSNSIILDAAHAIVKKIKGRKKKKLWTKKKGGQRIGSNASMDGREEARYVVKEINKWKEKGKKFKDFTILYRTNAQSRSIEEVLKQEGIPYDVIGGVRFFQRAEIKNAVSYLKIIINPWDYLSFRRIINIPSRGIGAITQDKIIDYSLENKKDFLSVMKQASMLPRIGNKIQMTLSSFSSLITKLQKEKIRVENNLIEKIKARNIIDIMLTGEQKEKKSPGEFIEMLESKKNKIKTFIEKNTTIDARRELSISKFIQRLLTADTKKNVELRDFIVKILNKAEQETLSLSYFFENILTDIEENLDFIKSLADKNSKITKVSDFNKKALATTSDYIRKILKDVGYIKMLKNDPDPRSIERLDNLEELLNDVIEFENSSDSPDLESFLEKIALFSDIDEKVDPSDEDEGKVTMMTVHSAKGLEFPIVFIVGLEEGIFPHIRSIEGKKESALNEERRLFYVAITRAMEKVYLTYARERTIHGKSHNQSPSRFLREVPEDLIDKYLPELSQRSFTRKIKSVLSKSTPKKRKALDLFNNGEIVKHKIFGRGKVISSNKGYVTIDFPEHGQKTLSQSFLEPCKTSGELIKSGDKVEMDGGIEGILKNTDGKYAYVIISNGDVEKVKIEMLKVKKD